MPRPADDRGHAARHAPVAGADRHSQAPRAGVADGDPVAHARARRQRGRRCRRRRVQRRGRRRRHQRPRWQRRADHGGRQAAAQLEEPDRDEPARHAVARARREACQGRRRHARDGHAAGRRVGREGRERQRREGGVTRRARRRRQAGARCAEPGHRVPGPGPARGHAHRPDLPAQRGRQGRARDRGCQRAVGDDARRLLSDRARRARRRGVYQRQRDAGARRRGRGLPRHRGAEPRDRRVRERRRPQAARGAGADHRPGRSLVGLRRARTSCASTVRLRPSASASW